MQLDLKKIQIENMYPQSGNMVILESETTELWDNLV